MLKRTARPKGQRAEGPSSAPADGGGSDHAPEAPAASATFPIVGIGASAGGLEAVTQLLHHIPPDSGMAFVLIQHLDPSHPSLLREALARATPMTVLQAEEGMPVEKNHVYVIPPDADLAILHGKLTLLPRAAGRPHLPIDVFFRALAAERGGQAIGVVLSGTASDGTEGLRAIKTEHGITFVQDPKTARFGGMPHSALLAGVVDYSLALPELARELMRLARHPYVADGRPSPRHDDTTLGKIFVVVRSAIGIDFSEYKQPTFLRRLSRRMAVRRVEGLEQYLVLLREDADEVRTLYEDLLIHVTSFMRDPEVYERLKTEVFPEILRNKPSGAPVRMWVAGCSTGEEVYSLAIILLETIGDSRPDAPIQLFGSDVSDKAIQIARAGVYSEGALREVSDERRRRYFTKTEHGYRINKTIRDLCVFVRHDLARDPPFAKLDFVSCRNVLIYFDQALQARVVPIFHYCLNQPGYLLLGRTENISSFGQLFRAVDKRNKIFARTAAPSQLRFAPRSEAHPVARVAARADPTMPPPVLDAARRLDHLLLSRYSPPAVLVDEKMDILQFRGETGAFLQPAPGSPQNNLVKMARRGLLGALRTTMAQAKKDLAPARTQGVAIEHDGTTTTCDLVVVPLLGPDVTSERERVFVVLFEESAARQATATPARSRRRPGTATETRHIQALEHELAATKDYLQGLLEEHNRTNDELGMVNDELVSGNEELQSMNEELETAKEELQSTNEELTTVNDELHSRNNDVSQINSDLVNLVSTVDIPILILDKDRRIRRFTPRARDMLNVLPTDIGRPVDDIRPNIQVQDLDRQVAEVIETLVMKETEVQDRQGRWHRMQIRPYRAIDDKIDGAILSLVDIDALKHHVSEAQRAKAQAEQASIAKDEFLAVLSHELRTPLSSLLLNAQLVLRGELDSVKLRRATEAIERSARTQVRLIDDLLDVSRIITGKLRMDMQAVDVAAVVQAAIEAMTPAAVRKGVRLETSLPRSDDRIQGDPARLHQVVSNLLANAVKFTPEGGLVKISLETAGGHVTLRVSDTGIGIAPTFLPKVFSRFTQADSSTVREHGGLGLGLAIVRHLVERHGGSVRAESPGVGKGATFSVELPLMVNDRPEDEAAAVSTPPLVTGGSAPGHGDQLVHRRILVVDDDPGTREAIAEMLVQAGASVHMAASASEALAAVNAFRPDVLVCDIAMPGEDGYSLIRRIRTLGRDRGGDVPAVALTALASDDDRRRALAAGFEMHIAKPVDIDRLLEALATLRGRPGEPRAS